MDEGHVLHPTMELLRSGGWDPGWYGYPPLTFYLTSIAARGVDFFQRHLSSGRSIVAEMPSREEVFTPAARRYDIVGPPGLIVTGRVVMLILGLGTVVFTGLLGGAVFGPRTGWAAALMVACCPSFVTRGSYVMVDTPTTFFVTLALYLVARLSEVDAKGEDGSVRSSLALAFGAGLACALAVASKYSVLALAPVAFVAVLVAASTVARALRWSLAFVAGLLAGLALGAPTLILRFGVTLVSLREQTALYSTWPATPTYLQTAARDYELGVPLLLCGAAGLVQMLRTRAHRTKACTWLAFAILLVAPFLRYAFQPLRNLLPLCPLLAVAGAHFVVGLLDRPASSRTAVSARWIGVVAGGAIALSFLVGIVRFHHSLVWRDTRVEAIDWLVRRVQPGDRVLIQEELAFLPSEIRRLPAATTIVTCERLAQLAATDRSTYLVVGGRQGESYVPGGAPTGCVPPSSTSELVAFGAVLTPPSADYWRTNLQALRILNTTDPASLSP